MGAARAVGAVFFSVIIGWCMHVMFRKEEGAATNQAMHMPEPETARSLGANVVFFAIMTGLLVSATWGRPETAGGFFHAVYAIKWYLSGGFALGLGVVMVRQMGVKTYKIIFSGLAVLLTALVFPGKPLVSFSIGILAFVAVLTTTRGETETWFLASWDFAKQIMPLLLAGILAAGMLLGRPGAEGLIPSHWVSRMVGGNSLWANLFASMVGAFMYFATLTEIPILQGLMGAGMGKGPALALLLAGPALSLPNMLVIRSVLGTKKTLVFIGLVVVMATMSGVIFGYLF
jgi:uncharacterized membrane protein YraQ (UPF0718 family)